MSKIIMLGAILLSMNAFAHVPAGEYSGVDQEGAKCTFTVGEIYFENDMHHPLTERLPLNGVTFKGVAVAQSVWSLGHPPVVNVELGSNRYNHDIFQQIVPTSNGAVSVTLIKGDEEKEGDRPVGIVFIFDNYKNKDESRKMTCLL